MKKVIILMLAVCAMLCGCGAEVERAGDTQPETVKSMFVEVESTWDWRVVYHKDTKVMYAVSCSSYNRGTFTLLVNADGTPMIWEE